MVRSGVTPKVLTSKRLARSWKVGFYEDMLQIGSGEAFPYARITVPNFAMVAAVRKSDGKMPLVKQYRHGAGREFWELPAGLIEEGESPRECIRREFREEVGYELLYPRLIAPVYTCPARSGEVAYVFTGSVGKRLESRLEINEILTVRFVSKELALRLLSRNISSTDVLAYLLSETF